LSEPQAELRDLLNAQTGRIGWDELARHFSRGAVLCVGPGEDLIAVAESLVRDRRRAVERLLENGSLRRAADDDARRWENRRSEFWAVVVAPWVLVQEVRA
jgi:hypothetical protein